MTGYLFDENLPAKIQFEPSYPIAHVSALSKNPSDGEIWRYAEQNDLVISGVIHRYVEGNLTEK